MTELKVSTDKAEYSMSDVLRVRVEAKITGGLREAFHPDVWTVAWEDFDKILRLTFRVDLKVKKGIGFKALTNNKKRIRRASFYWSRDPDLPYRIWAMIMPEDGGAPKIPRNAEDAKAKMLDLEEEFAIPASAFGKGTHRLVAEARGRWGRRSFIEKGEVTSRSKPLAIQIE